MLKEKKDCLSSMISDTIMLLKQIKFVLLNTFGVESSVDNSQHFISNCLMELHKTDEVVARALSYLHSNSTCC